MSKTVRFMLLVIWILGLYLVIVVFVYITFFDTKREGAEGEAWTPYFPTLLTRNDWISHDKTGLTDFDFGLNPDKWPTREVIRQSNNRTKLATVDEVNEYIEKARTLPIKPEEINFIDDKNPCWKNNSELRNLPNFYIPLFPKTASTDLFYLVSQHPNVAKTSKETHFWSRMRFGKVKWLESFNMEKYVKMGSESEICKDKKIIRGDASTSMYFNWRIRDYEHYTDDLSNSTVRTLENFGILSWHLLHRYTPHAKYIIIFRNPIGRVLSHFLFQYYQKRNYSRYEFHRSVVENLRTIEMCLKINSLRYCAYEKRVVSQKATVFLGMYVVFINDFLKVIPRKNVLFLRTEDYAKDRMNILSRVFKFLDLENNSKILDKIDFSKKKNRRKIKESESSKMRLETRELLEKFYKPFNEELAELLNHK